MLSPTVAVESAPNDQRDLGEPQSVEKQLGIDEVMDAFLEQNPQPTPFMVHALLAAGAAHLSDSEAVVRVCEKIASHGYQYPLNPTLRRQLGHRELLPYLKWHADTQVERESYRDENSISMLVHQFRHDSGKS